MEEQERKKCDDAIKNAGLSAAGAEVVQRYGAAAKEHLVAYSGVDNERGRVLAKGLKSISESKVNPKYYDANIKQQAGFSAEVKTQARESAERIIGKQTTRTTRTDDMVKQSDGRGGTIGGKNEQYYDIAQVDANGVYIEGTGRQLKYVGGTAKECTQKLLDKRFDKYREHDVPIEVPSDFYDEVHAQLGERIENCQKQLEAAKSSGNIEKIQKKQEELERIKKTQRDLRKGKLTNKEAINARLHPERSTVKEIAGISHRAGVESAKTGAAIGGGISAIQNTVAVIKGDKEPGEAVLAVAGDTAKAGVVSYATGFVGSAIKGAMQNAPSEYIRALSKTNLPGTIVVSVLEVGKTLGRYAKGELDGVECLTELGEKGTGMLASSAGAAVGQALIPIPVVGALVGSMVGYAMASSYYNSLVSVLREAKVAHEERLRIEAECAAAVQAIREYRLQIELAVNNYMQEHMAAFSTAFAEMESAWMAGDADQFIRGTNRITHQLGGTPLFETKQACDALMKSTAIISI